MGEDEELRQWFCEEVLPLEAELTRFLRGHWRQTNDIPDLRQDTYEAALNAAQHCLPTNTRAYLFTIARNLIINKAKRARVVSFEQIADLEQFDSNADLGATDRYIDARDALRRAQAGLNALPPRCREVVRLRKVEGLNTRETADRLGIGIHTVERQLVIGIQAMADYLLGGTGRIRRDRSVDHRHTRP